MRFLVSILALLVGAPSAGADDTVPVVSLRDRVVVAADDVRWIDLASGPLPSDFGRRVVLSAPAPGRERTWTRAQILREAVRAGHSVVPRLAGHEEITIRRRGGAIPPDRLASRVRAILDEQPLPAGTLDDAFEILRLPTLRTGGGGVTLALDGPVPRVGRGAVPLRATTADGSTRRLYAMVSRSVRLPILRTNRAVDARTPVTFAHAVVDTVWTDDGALFDRHLPTDGLDGRHTLVRSVRGGHVLRDGDVRPSPVVRRGETVHWIVERDGLRVAVRARARNDGAVGEWISVLSPFDQRQRRVVVVAPGVVANHPPEPQTRADARSVPKGQP